MVSCIIGSCCSCRQSDFAFIPTLKMEAHRHQPMVSRHLSSKDCMSATLIDCRTSCGSGGPDRGHQRLLLAAVQAWRGSCRKPAGGHVVFDFVPRGLGALTYHLSVLRYPTDTAHRAVRQSGTLAQPIASRGCPCPSFARTHRTLATLPFAVSEAGSRKRFMLRRSM